MLRAGDAGVAIDYSLDLRLQSSWPLRRRHKKIQLWLKVVLLLRHCTAPRFTLGTYRLANFGLAALRHRLRRLHQRLNPMRRERFKRNDVRLQGLVKAESLRNRELVRRGQRLCS